MHSETYLKPEVACPNVKKTFDLANAVEGSVVHVFILGTYTGLRAPVSHLYLDMFKRKTSFAQDDAKQRLTIEQISTSKTNANRQIAFRCAIVRAEVNLQTANDNLKAEERATKKKRRRQEEEENGDEDDDDIPILDL